MLITGAVTAARSGPFSIERLELDDPRPDEVLVRIVATGLCHTDLIARDGQFDFPFPAVLGHEGAGGSSGSGHRFRTFSPATTSS